VREVAHCKIYSTIKNMHPIHLCQDQGLLGSTLGRSGERERETVCMKKERKKEEEGEFEIGVWIDLISFGLN
jgi:hypothetical protein